jgi:L-ribulose-5-phosphate 3-epimerase
VKKGLTQICLGRDKPIRECLELCKEIGYAGLEATITEEGDLNLNATEADLRRLRDLSREIGVEYTSIAGGAPRGASMTSDNPEERRAAVEGLAKTLQVAAGLGVDCVLTTGGRVTDDVAYDVAYDRLKEGVKQLAPVADRTRVNLAVENVWNKLLLSPLEMRDFIDDIGSEHVGVFFDTGNIVLYGFPEQWIRILGKRVKKVHFKDFKRQGYQWTQLMQGDVNWPKVMAELRSIGYDDYVITEVCGSNEVYAETCRVMDQILAL